MNFYVYVLRDDRNRFYKGITNNITRRLKEHRSGNTITTSKMKDVNVVYTESYDNFLEARKREVYLKTAAGRRFLKKTIIFPP